MRMARKAPLRHMTRGRALRLALGIAILAAAILAARHGRAAEWTVPPGVNIASQESALKERVTRAARAMLGEDLVDVVVHIGYVRVGALGQAARPDRVKLPGFNNYIVPSATEEPAIVSEFSRVRQVFVMVSDQSRVQYDVVSRELATQTGMNPAQGDTLSVIPVAAPRPGEGAAPGAMPAMPGMGEPGEPRMTARPPPARPLTPEELREPRSTAHLMQARRQYFAGNHQGALEEILQAITVDPNNAQAYAMLGSLYYAMNWRGLAVKYWQRSLELDPTNREIEDLITQIRVQGP